MDEYPRGEHRPTKKFFCFFFCDDYRNLVYSSSCLEENAEILSLNPLFPLIPVFLGALGKLEGFDNNGNALTLREL